VIRGVLLACMALVLCVGGTVLAHPSACPSASAFTWHPARPRAGTLFRIHLRGDPGAVITARLAGEPLHFTASNDSVWAFAAVPVDSSNGVTLSVLCLDGSRLDLPVRVRDGVYPLERLRVAPSFGAPPDSALQARQRREAALAAAVSRDAHQTPRLYSEPFRAPRPSRITSPFGGGRTFNGTVTSRHLGTDYQGAVGAPVRAVNRGVVRLVESFHLGGNVVYLDHGAGLVTAYLHLSRHRVAVGDTVQRGEIIGELGATGRVTGPHLHLIVRYGSIPVDPESLIERP
jgi:murein DD-endopeptidase MepM/ murein hydrolase activator NlpD